MCVFLVCFPKQCQGPRGVPQGVSGKVGKAGGREGGAFKGAEEPRAQHLEEMPGRTHRGMLEPAESISDFFVSEFLHVFTPLAQCVQCRQGLLSPKSVGSSAWGPPRACVFAVP